MKEAIIIHLDEPEAEAETFIAYMPGWTLYSKVKSKNHLLFYPNDKNNIYNSKDYKIVYIPLYLN